MRAVDVDDVQGQRNLGDALRLGDELLGLVRPSRPAGSGWSAASTVARGRYCRTASSRESWSGKCR
jgi:hypothetical protein